MQQYTVYLYLPTALHVSGGICTHHQKLISLYLQYLALLRPLLLRQVAVTVSIMPYTVDTVIWAPDDSWGYHPKHVEKFADINKLCIGASCWIINDTYYAMHGPLNIKFRSSFLRKISAEHSKVRRQTWSFMESTVRESWLIREADASSVSSNKRTRALPCQSHLSLPRVNKRLCVLLLSSQKLFENDRICRLFLEIRQFRCIVQHWLWFLRFAFWSRSLSVVATVLRRDIRYRNVCSSHKSSVNARDHQSISSFFFV